MNDVMDFRDRFLDVTKELLNKHARCVRVAGAAERYACVSEHNEPCGWGTEFRNGAQRQFQTHQANALFDAQETPR